MMACGLGQGVRAGVLGAGVEEGAGSTAPWQPKQNRSSRQGNHTNNRMKEFFMRSAPSLCVCHKRG